MAKKKLPDSNIELGGLLKKARSLRHVTQADVALEAGVAKNHISAIERGVFKPNVHILLSYCRVLDMTPDEILGIKNIDELKTSREITIIPELKAQLKHLDEEQQRKLAATIRSWLS